MLDGVSAERMKALSYMLLSGDPAEVAEASPGCARMKSVAYEAIA